MNPTGPLSDDAIDALVRAHLQRQAETVDAAALLTRAKTTLRRELPRPRRGRTVRRWLVGLAAAAVALLAFLGGWSIGPGRASAEAVVRGASKAHALPVDRCYHVEARLTHESPDERFPLLSQVRVTRLWTRGDRFWMESAAGPRQWKWGRDEQGTLWIALSRNQGIRFDGQEPPEQLATACEVLGLKVETLLDQVLHRTRLTRETPPDGATARIRAEPKNPSPEIPFRSAVLDIDVETHAVRRLEVVRSLRGGRFTFTTTFTLIETGYLDDSRYSLEGHLEEPHQIFSRSFEPRRGPTLLARFFGLKSLEGSRPPE